MLYEVITYVLKTLEEHYPKVLFDRYSVDHVEDDFILTLDIIGKKRGCLIKGGEIDYDKVISIIINEIKNGTLNRITSYNVCYTKLLRVI